MRFSTRELFDISAAWVALGVAFTLFIITTYPDANVRLFPEPVGISGPFVTRLFLLSMLTVGVGFLLHELAHKVTAVQFGQLAEFRADYTMLAVAIMASLAGFLFAAPGAVVHSGRISRREHGLIAVAGPLTNVVLAGAFFPLVSFGGFLGDVGQLGVTVNAILAGFNMLPFGPLDGKKVLSWSKIAFLLTFALCGGLAVLAFLFVGFPV